MRGPLVGASAVVVRGDRVLLGRRRGAHGTGTFAFPGGKPRPGESPLNAVIRELREETGLIATSAAPITWTDEVFPNKGLHFVTLHYLVEVPPGVEPVVLEPEKCASWNWYPWSALPEPLFSATAEFILKVVNQFPDWSGDENRIDGIALRLANIGEVAGQLSEELQMRLPEVPWRQMIAMRHRIVHDYVHVELEYLQEVVNNHLHPLLTAKVSRPQ